MQSLELLIENVNANGNFTDDGDFVTYLESEGIYRFYPSNLSLKTERSGAPATLSGEIPDVRGHVPAVGSTIRLKVDGVRIFYGHIFQVSIDKYGVINFTAYDNIRYLKNTFSGYYPKTYKISEVINDIAIAFNLPVGHIDEIPHQGMSLMIDNECALDVICKLTETAMILTERAIIFYADDNGDLTLRYSDDMIADVLIGDDSLATEYSLSVSIDEDTYNQILLYRESESAGCRHGVTEYDEATTLTWGVLRLTESVEDVMSLAQMQDRAEKMLTMKDRPTKSMSITALGIVGLRAGMMVNIHFPSIPDDISKKQTVILDSVTHNFEDGNHTMNLEVHTFWRNI